MKKYIKKICMILLIVLFMWLIIFFTNYIKCIKLKKPILMQADYVKSIEIYKDKNGNEYSINTIHFKGLGYKIDNSINIKTEETIRNKMYLFDFLINQTSKI